MRTACRVAIAVALALGWMAGSAAAQPAITITSGRLGNLLEQGDPRILQVGVRADPGATLRGRLEVLARDAYGRRAGRLTRRIDLAPGGGTTIDFAIRSRRPLGHFSIGARIRGDGRRILAQVESAAAIVPPARPPDAERCGVGYYVYPQPDELPRAMEIAGQMRRVGICWVRLKFNWWTDRRWSRPDTSDPAWLDSAAFEQWVDAFRANGIEVLGVLFGTARWASSAPDDLTDVVGIPRYGVVKPRDLGDWLLLAHTLASRLAGRIRHWEVWNEADVSSFWQSGEEDFATLVRETASVLRAVDPEIRVGVNVVNRGTEPGLRFSDVLLAGAGDSLDMFGLHYGNDQWVAELRELATPLLRPGAKFWNTEAWGAPRRLIAHWLAQRTAGVEKIFTFIYRLNLDDGAVESIHRFGRYPVNLDYTPRHDAVAVRTLSDLVGRATPLGVADVGLGWQAFTFDDGGDTVVAVVDRNELGETWSGPPGYTLVLRIPPGVQLITAVDLMGNRETLAVRRGRVALRVLGVGTFLLVEPRASLAGLELEEVRARRR